MSRLSASVNEIDLFSDNDDLASVILANIPSYFDKEGELFAKTLLDHAQINEDAFFSDFETKNFEEYSIRL